MVVGLGVGCAQEGGKMVAGVWWECGVRVVKRWREDGESVAGGW